MESLPSLLSVEAVAHRLSLSRHEVYELIKKGDLPAHRIGKRIYRISDDSLNIFIERENSGVEQPRIPKPNPSSTLSQKVQHKKAKKAPEPISPPRELDPHFLPETAQSIPPTHSITVDFLMQEWLDDARGRIRPKTYLSYAQIVRVHIVPLLGKWQAGKLEVRTIERFLQYKYQSGLSARSVQYIRALLRQAYNEAIRWGWLNRNVAALARGPKAERPLIKIIAPEEARRLLDSFAYHRYGPLFVTVLGLGLRLGEALGLRWDDIRLDAPRQDNTVGQLTVRVQLQRIGGECELVAPKSRTSVRALSLPGFVEDTLRLRREQQRAERTEAIRWNNVWNLVFTNKCGEPLDESRVRQRFHEHLKAQGFPPMRLHDLRHLCASLLLSQGTHPRVLMELLGHSQISLTLDTYAHVMPSAHSEAARAMEKALQRR